MYRQGAFLLTGWQDDDLPSFSSIQDILVIEKWLLFDVIMFTTVSIDRHFHSFVVHKGRRRQIVTLDEIIDPHPLYGHYVCGNSSVYISVRSHVQTTE